MLCNYSRYLGSQRRGENFLQLAQVGFGDGYGVGFASLVPRPPRCILLYCQVMNTGARCLELLLQRGDVFARGGRPAHSYDHSRQVDTPRFPHVRLAYLVPGPSRDPGSMITSLPCPGRADWAAIHVLPLADERPVRVSSVN